MSVSILTLVQFCRSECLYLLNEYVKNQTYENIKEWVIVEGSKSEPDAICSKQFVENLKNFSLVQIIYVEYEPNCLIGKLRNKGNDACTGDYIVCMDDDDWYDVKYVEESVKGLLQSETLTGICAVNIYDHYFNRSYQFATHEKVGSAVIPNCTMSYTKKYTTNHFYDETVLCAEEDSFTNSFTEKICIIDSNLMCLNSHNQNTFNKRQLFILHEMGQHQLLSQMVNCVIPQKYLRKYNQIFNKKLNIDVVNKYDIIYYCGHSIPWSPNDKNLGGSEQAVKHLSEEWAKVGYAVAVYGSVNCEIVNGVNYFHWRDFPYREKLNILIIWRPNGLIGIMSFFNMIYAKKTLLDLHDNFPTNDSIAKICNLFRDKINYVMFKSEFHKNEFDKLDILFDTNINVNNKQTLQSKYVVVPNGVRDEFINFDISKITNRDKYRFIYCSCYSRGLIHILQYIWPTIVALQPLAELHIYYGMSNLTTDEQNIIYNLIAKTKNVMNHGRANIDIIIREKSLSSFHLYITDSVLEIDCISIKESLCMGCIPLLSKFNVFNERDGVKFDVDFSNPQSLIQCGNCITNILNSNDLGDLDIIRNEFKKSSTIVSWKDVSTEWINLMFDSDNNMCYKKSFDDLQSKYIFDHLCWTIPNAHVDYLYLIKNKFMFEPKVIYDIGSNLLHWTKKAKKVWPDSQFILFEAINELEFLHAIYKNNHMIYDYNIGLLSDEDNKAVKFYQNLNETCGSSIYREIGHERSSLLYQEDKFVIKNIVRLDTLVKQKKIPLPDLIKIDVQGSEIDVLNGAKNIINNVKYLIVELQNVEYNKGAMLSDKSVKYIEENFDFVLLEKFCVNERGFDSDYCFVKKY